MSIRLVSNLNCFKIEIPLCWRDFLFGNICFCDSKMDSNWLYIKKFLKVSCFQCAKVTKMKANHNQTS